MGRPAEALPLLGRSLERSHPGASIVRKLFALIMDCHRQLGHAPEALAACRDGRKYYPDDALLLFQEALLRDESGDLQGEEACLQRLLETREPEHFSSVAEGLRGFRARHQLAVLYHKQGRGAEAEAQWRAALTERPHYAPAWLGLGELYLRQGRWVEVEEFCRWLEAEQGPKGQIHGAYLRASGSLARKEYGAARHTAEAALAHFPREVMLWVVLSHALLQEVTNETAAERVLRHILDLDPGNQQAKTNLAVLLRRRGQPC
jgi:tetratricopeptide (TPR) repeat protein